MSRFPQNTSPLEEPVPESVARTLGNVDATRTAELNARIGAAARTSAAKTAAGAAAYAAEQERASFRDVEQIRSGDRQAQLAEQAKNREYEQEMVRLDNELKLVALRAQAAGATSAQDYFDKRVELNKRMLNLQARQPGRERQLELYETRFDREKARFLTGMGSMGRQMAEQQEEGTADGEMFGASLLSGLGMEMGEVREDIRGVITTPINKWLVGDREKGPLPWGVLTGLVGLDGDFILDMMFGLTSEYPDEMKQMVGARMAAAGGVEAPEAIALGLAASALEDTRMRHPTGGIRFSTETLDVLSRAREYFTGDMLQGGPLTPEQIEKFEEQAGKFYEEVIAKKLDSYGEEGLSPQRLKAFVEDAATRVNHMYMTQRDQFAAAKQSGELHPDMLQVQRLAVDTLGRLSGMLRATQQGLEGRVIDPTAFSTAASHYVSEAMLGGDIDGVVDLIAELEGTDVELARSIVLELEEQAKGILDPGTVEGLRQARIALEQGEAGILGVQFEAEMAQEQEELRQRQLFTEEMLRGTEDAFERFLQENAR